MVIDYLFGAFTNKNYSPETSWDSQTIPTPPTGYRNCIQFSGEYATGGGNNAVVYVDNKYVAVTKTWGGKTFYEVKRSCMYDLETDFPPKPLNTIGGDYPGTGHTIQFANENSNNWCTIVGFTVHGFWVSDNTICKWRRTA